MASIVDRVKANEALYRNIETETQWTYKLGNPKYHSENVITASTTRSRRVLQGDLFYLRIDGQAESFDKVTETRDTLQGYDGQRTRIVDQNAVANIHEGRFADYRFTQSDPFMMFFQRFGFVIPLSTFLQGTSGIRQQPGWEKHNLEVSYQGEETVDGLRCARVRCRSFPDGYDGPADQVGYWDLWLAVERNYLPIRYELFQGRMKGQAERVGRLSDLKQIAPGVWFPSRASFVVYDKMWFNEDGKLVVSNSEEFVFEKVQLDPHYDISLFRDIPIPEGMIIYHIRDGKIVETTNK